MSEQRANYSAGRSHGQRLTATLAIDLDDDQVASYLLERINANPLTRERGAEPLDLDYATLDFLLDAVQPRHPLASSATHEETDKVFDAFEESYQAREWLRNFSLSATLQYQKGVVGL